ncbi:MAG TPA: tail fiber domain-containing protein [Candidatus Babeliales bacterium]|nr:tail fiber domain-containing protein [Candidatus Babeliales bacterium]
MASQHHESVRTITASNVDVFDTLSVSNLDIFGTTTGIRDVTTIMNDAISVVVDSTGKLGTVSSSIRFKENVQDIGDITNLVMQLRPVIFNYINDIEKKKQYGLIAEEVAPLFPELVVNDTNGQIYTVSYHLLYAILLNEIQKLRNDVDFGRATIKDLIARIIALENV